MEWSSSSGGGGKAAARKQLSEASGQLAAASQSQVGTSLASGKVERVHGSYVHADVRWRQTATCKRFSFQSGDSAQPAYCGISFLGGEQLASWTRWQKEVQKNVADAIKKNAFAAIPSQLAGQSTKFGKITGVLLLDGKYESDKMYVICCGVPSVYFAIVKVDMEQNTDVVDSFFYSVEVPDRCFENVSALQYWIERQNSKARRHAQNFDFPTKEPVICFLKIPGVKHVELPDDIAYDIDLD